MGVAFSYYLFMLSGRLARAYPEYLSSLEKSGNYIEPADSATTTPLRPLDANLLDGADRSSSGSDGGRLHQPPRINYVTWAKQMAAWCFITVLARMLVCCVMLIFRDILLEELSAYVALHWSCDPTGLLVMVMLGCPVCMNIGQLWVQDQFLQAKSDSKDNERLISTSVVHHIQAEPDQDLRLSLTQQLARLSSAQALEGSAQDLQRQMRRGPERPRVQEYQKFQKQCCKLTAIIGGSIVTVVFLFAYSRVVWSHQADFDPCYVHVRSDDNILVNKESGLFNNPNNRLNAFPFYGYPPNLHNFTKVHANEKTGKKCRPENEHSTIRSFVENRDTLRLQNTSDTYVPVCMCCNNRAPRQGATTGRHNRAPNNCKQNGKGKDKDKWTCPNVGECCDRSTVLQFDLVLRESCAVCNIYNPCDQERCAARPDNIRNHQHIPMIVGVLFSLISNIYVIYTYKFDSKLREATATKLLVWASVVEVFYCICFGLQELSFRVPDTMCDSPACAEPSGFHAWPTWSRVADAYYKAYGYGDDPHWLDSAPPGQRGSAINWCMPMSFLYQLTWTASDTLYFMISIDLWLNLYASPFGSTKTRLLWYHIITWSLAFGFAIALVASGDWGVSHESLMEDFCWNVNFGRLKNDHSNWPFYMRVVYGLSVAYYVISLGIVVVAKAKISSLTMGQKEAREKSIREGIWVVAISSIWLGAWFLLYLGVLHNTQGVVKSLNVYPYRKLREIPWEETANPAFPVDYGDGGAWVTVWGFSLGARNVINFIIWRFVVIPRLNRDFKTQFFAKFKSFVQRNSVEEEDPRELKKVLQTELLFFTGLGIRGACRLAVEPATHEMDRSSQPWSSPAEAPSADSAEIGRGSQEVEVPLLDANATEKKLDRGVVEPILWVYYYPGHSFIYNILPMSKLLILSIVGYRMDRCW
eukprot:COSAG01_NODE_704_length_14147_cov_5.083648_12_plen_925_part_00